MTTATIRYLMQVSLDGFMEAPGHDIGWTNPDAELHTYMNDLERDVALTLYGRRTYELMEGYWPTADQDPSSTRPMVEFARIWRDMPKYVYSRTLERAEWGTVVIRDVVPDEVCALAEQADGDLFLGGARLSAAFLEQDLVDEFRLYLHPVLLGAGTPLFPAAGARRDLRLVENRTFGNGVVLLRYERVVSPPG